MSVKRAATTDLNHENWDQDDPSEHEEMGTFKTAPKEVMEKRVIKTAKRRSQAALGTEAKKSVFSGFGGFNKTQPQSFDFLSNLTNGSKNNETNSKSETVASSLFKNASGSGGLFNMPVSSSQIKPAFGISTPQTSVFGGSSSNVTSPSSSLFNPAKVDSTRSSTPFKMQATGQNVDGDSPKATSTNIFGSTGTTTGTGTTKSLFSSTSATTFKTQPETTTTSPSLSKLNSNFDINKHNDNTVKTDVKKDEKKQKYYAKIKGLNESVSDWIQKHVKETPLCILTPIFKDYEKYLKEIEDEYQCSLNTFNDADKDKEKQTKEKNNDKVEISLISKIDSVNTNTSSIFSSQAVKLPSNVSTNSTLDTPTTIAGFSFGINTTPPSTNTTAAFPLSTMTTSKNENSSTPFSFGTGKPFSFNSSVQIPTATAPETNQEEDEPPKVEFTPIVEENSVFDKRCKIFIKKDGNFVDNGVGTLYIKKIEDSNKHQLLVRANNNLGTVILNFILASAIPTQRMGKNNVMMICIPNPDSKPPPTPILLRVKTSEEADELLEILNKYKS